MTTFEIQTCRSRNSTSEKSKYESFVSDQASRWCEPIRCELYNAYLQDRPHYEALSYVWGKGRRLILLNGGFREVTANLEAALRRLRYSHDDRHLWVDALCIDQNNDIEKSHQVRLMREIYSQTAMGLLWLGDFGKRSVNAPPPSTNDLELSVEPEPSRLGSGAFPPAPNRRDVDRAGTCATTISGLDVARAFLLIESFGRDVDSESGEGQDPGNNLITSETLDALDHLTNLGWWNRVWTVQEVILPPKAKFICGSMQTDWTTVERAARNMAKLYFTHGLKGKPEKVLSAFVAQVVPITSLREYPWDKRNLLWALTDFRDRLATDPKDKIYAFLGLPDSTSRQLSRSVDYTLTRNQVYQNTCRRMIRIWGNLMPLMRLREYDRDPSLPTWVPDWTAKGDGQANYGYWVTTAFINIHQCFRFSEHTSVDLDEDSMAPENELKLRGVIVDEVEVLGPPETAETREASESPHEELVARWKMLSLECKDVMARPYPYGGTYCNAFWRTAANDVTYDERLRSYTRLRGGNIDSLDRDDCFAIGAELAGRGFFVSKKGLLGLAPVGTEIGDTIHVFHGDNFPFILRPVRQENRQDTYTYVGHSYVHGIMDGEATTRGAFPSQWTTIL